MGTMDSVITNAYHSPTTSVLPDPSRPQARAGESELDCCPSLDPSYCQEISDKVISHISPRTMGGIYPMVLAVGIPNSLEISCVSIGQSSHFGGLDHSLLGDDYLFEILSHQPRSFSSTKST